MSDKERIGFTLCRTLHPKSDNGSKSISGVGFHIAKPPQGAVRLKVKKGDTGSGFETRPAEVERGDEVA